jgi:hypothetical protein
LSRPRLDTQEIIHFPRFVLAEHRRSPGGVATHRLGHLASGWHAAPDDTIHLALLADEAPATTIEILTPDFLRKDGALEILVAAKPDVFNHNLETVARLQRASAKR